jgi:two-component system NarL family sensor kinase
MGATAGLIESTQRATGAPELRAATPRADAGGSADRDLRRLADSLLRMLESDRAHVSDALGNEIVSVITMGRYLIEDAAQRLARGELEASSEALRNASTRIRDATGQLLALCSQLRPKLLDDLGLLPALNSYFRDFSRENRAVLLSPRITISEADLPASLKLPMFRIVQAALSNVARHSKASAVRIFLSNFEAELRLGIEDNGIGFDVEGWRHRRRANGGCGLSIIRLWVEITGGRCIIEAAPRHGARVQVFWPMSALGETPPSESEHAKSDVLSASTSV